METKTFSMYNIYKSTPHTFIDTQTEFYAKSVANCYVVLNFCLKILLFF